MNFTTSLTHIASIRHDDEDVQRRGRNVVVIAVGIVIFSCVLALVGLVSGYVIQVVGLVVACVLVQTAVIVMARRGFVSAAALIMVVMAIVGAAGAQLVLPAVTLPFQLILPLLIAGLTLRPLQVWLTYGLAMVALFVMWQVVSQSSSAEAREIFTSAGGLLTLSALIAALNSASTQRALVRGQQARTDAEIAADALQALNLGLEARVAERTADLTHSLAAQQQQAAALRASLSAQQQLDALVLELSLPIIPIRHDTLVVPLVGALDGLRATQMIARVLEAVEQQRVRRVLIDVTGVAIIDTQVAAVLLKLALSMRLLGAQATLVGMRPEVAQALVGLGVDLRDLNTAATLQQGLERRS
ncbi:MAG: STAS domain-containing protein [Roseiflexaceae bacterium]|nr:STAS domain-containing protein [Roseiflexaceae bacterium]